MELRSIEYLTDPMMGKLHAETNVSFTSWLLLISSLTTALNMSIKGKPKFFTRAVQYI